MIVQTLEVYQDKHLGKKLFNFPDLIAIQIDFETKFLVLRYLYLRNCQ